VRRLTILISLLLAALVTGVPSANAWPNGPASGGKAGYGYGTHDWILEHAIVLAGDDADWVEVDTALWHTNDPDYLHTSSDFHLFREKGRSRGGPQKVADLYYDAFRSLSADDRKTASIKLGVLSHYYADMLVPFHTTYDAIDRPKTHFAYERSVDAYQRRYADPRRWIVKRGPKHVEDVRARAVSAARYSRTRYGRLLTALRRNPRIASNHTVDTITRELLSRAVNDLADVIRALPSGEGTSSPPATMTVSLSNPRPSRGRKVCAYAACADQKGRPVEGVRVDFLWSVGSKAPVKASAYTDEAGIAYKWRAIEKDAAGGTACSVNAVARSSGRSIAVRRAYTIR